MQAIPWTVRPTLAAASWRNLLILAVYGYQGIVAGFGLTTLPNHYAGLGVTTEAIGAHVALVGLPWVLQPLWGPVVDRYGDFRMGRRRFWVVSALMGALAALSLLPLAGGQAPGDLPWISLALLGHSVFAALLDTALDGMIMDQVPPARLGQATALTRVGFVGGTALGAAIFAWLLPAQGLAASTALLLAFGGLALLPCLLLREGPGDALLSLRRHGGAARTGTGSARSLALRLLAALRRRDSIALFLLCIAEEFATAVLGLRLGVAMFQEGGWDPAALSRLQGGLGLAVGTVGAVCVGWWSDRVGPYRALALLLALCALAYASAALLLLATPLSSGVAALALAVTAGVPALAFVALAAAVMRSHRGAGAATRFALFMAALNLGGVAGSAASGPVGALLPPWQVALVAAVVFAACTAAAARPGCLFPLRHGP